MATGFRFFPDFVTERGSIRFPVYTYVRLETSHPLFKCSRNILMRAPQIPVNPDFRNSDNNPKRRGICFKSIHMLDKKRKNVRSLKKNKKMKKIASYTSIHSPYTSSYTCRNFFAENICT